MRDPDEMIVLVIERDLPVLARSLPYIRRFLNPKKLTIIAPEACLTGIRELNLTREGERLLEEDEAVPGLNLELVRSVLEKRGCDPRRAGWYFKQLVILAYATRPDASRCYLNWDADTIPARPICFFDRDGRALLAKKRGHNRPYFRTIERLTGLKRQVSFSFIAENMLFDRETTRELIDAIMKGSRFEGEAFARTVLGAIADDDLPGSGFSEYETYGTFARARHPERISLRNIASMRHGSFFFGRSPSDAQLFAVSTLFSWASFEWWSLSSPIKRVVSAAARIAGSMWRLFALLAMREAYKEFREDARPGGRAL